jgi:hypothetical protein
MVYTCSVFLVGKSTNIRSFTVCIHIFVLAIYYIIFVLAIYILYIFVLAIYICGHIYIRSGHISGHIYICSGQTYKLTSAQFANPDIIFTRTLPGSPHITIITRADGFLLQYTWEHWDRVGQNRICMPHMTVYLVVSLPIRPYIHRVYIYGSGQP